jgi:uncharacterized protein YpmB
MEEKSIPYFAHEGMMVRMERTNHRLWILSIVLIVCLIVSNLAWILYESQFEYYEETTQEVTQNADAEEGDAVNRFIGGDDYGESNADD